MKKRSLCLSGVRTKASGNLYSLIETAKANGVNTYGYLRVVFKELPNAQSVESIEKLLPWDVSTNPDPV